MSGLFRLMITLGMALVLFGSLHRGLAADPDAATQIKSIMTATFDRPDARLQVDPVVIASGYAIAGWSQADIGGRALLRRKGHDWQIVLCSGDQIRSAEALVKIGLPADVSKSLSEQLAEAERKIAPARLAQFSKFDGIVMMDAAGNHPPGHQGH